MNLKNDHYTVFKASKHKKCDLIFLSILLATCVTLTGCGSSETNVVAGNKSGTLYWGNGTEPQSLDPQIATGVPEHHVISAVMEGWTLPESTARLSHTTPNRMVGGGTVSNEASPVPGPPWLVHPQPHAQTVAKAATNAHLHARGVPLIAWPQALLS